MRRDANGHGGSATECHVRLWRGYVSGQFYASRSGSNEAFLCSATFRIWRPPWQPKLRLEESIEAAAALEWVVAELNRRGWTETGSDGWAERTFGRVGEPDPPSLADPANIGEEWLLRTLDRTAGEEGATSAELCRALYGDGAPAVRNLPLHIGNRLRTLQRQGKVVRREREGVNRWYVADAGPG